MNKFIIAAFLVIFSYSHLYSATKVNPIIDGDPDAKIHLIVFESLTCGHCANFHNNIYPDLKKNFVEKGLVNI